MFQVAVTSTSHPSTPPSLYPHPSTVTPPLSSLHSSSLHPSTFSLHSHPSTLIPPPSSLHPHPSTLIPPTPPSSSLHPSPLHLHPPPSSLHTSTPHPFILTLTSILIPPPLTPPPLTPPPSPQGCIVNRTANFLKRHDYHIWWCFNEVNLKTKSILVRHFSLLIRSVTKIFNALFVC